MVDWNLIEVFAYINLKFPAVFVLSRCFCNFPLFCNFPVFIFSPIENSNVTLIRAFAESQQFLNVWRFSNNSRRWLIYNRLNLNLKHEILDGFPSFKNFKMWTREIHPEFQGITCLLSWNSGWISLVHILKFLKFPSFHSWISKISKVNSGKLITSTNF